MFVFVCENSIGRTQQGRLLNRLNTCDTEKYRQIVDFAAESLFNPEKRSI